MTTEKSESTPDGMVDKLLDEQSAHMDGARIVDSSPARLSNTGVSASNLLVTHAEAMEAAELLENTTLPAQSPHVSPEKQHLDPITKYAVLAAQSAQKWTDENGFEFVPDKSLPAALPADEKVDQGDAALAVSKPQLAERGETSTPDERSDGGKEEEQISKTDKHKKTELDVGSETGKLHKLM